MATPNRPAEMAHALIQQPLQTPLRNRQDVQRADTELGQVQRQRAEREPRDGTDPRAPGSEGLPQPPVVQHRHDLTHQPVALRDLADLGQPFQHHRIQAGQTKLCGEHQPGRTTAGDHHIDIHRPSPLSRRQRHSNAQPSSILSIPWGSPCEARPRSPDPRINRARGVSGKERRATRRTERRNAI